MNDQHRQRVDRFLEAFYGQSREALRESLKERTWTNVVVQGAVRALRGRFHPAVLPRERDGGLAFYGIAPDRARARQLREQLMAFVGPSYSDFTGVPARLNPADPIEAAILDFTPAPAYRFRAGRGLESDLLRKLELMQKVLTGEERRGSEDLRPTGRVLRDFYLALQAGNRAAAEEHLIYLRSTERLEVLNLEFLEVQLRAEMGAWTEILQLPNFGDLVQARRPPAVTTALNQALYRTHIAPFEVAMDVPGAIAAFRDEVLPISGTLLEARAGQTQPEILKTFMLAAVAGEPPRPELRDELLTIPGLPLEDAAFLAALGAQISATSPAEAEDSLMLAAAALNDFRLDDAVRLALETPPSLEQARLLLQCADELPATEVQHAALAAVDALPEEVRERLFQFRSNREIWARVTGEGAAGALLPSGPPVEIPSIPTDWLAWFDLLERPQASPARVARLAAQGGDEWLPQWLTEEPGRIAALAARINHHAGDPVLQNALPHLVRFLQRASPSARPDLRPLCDVLRLVLVYGQPSGTAAELVVFHELCQTVLDLGVQLDEYRKMLDDARTLWSLASSPAALPAMLDVLDLLAYFRRGEDAPLQALAAIVVAFAVQQRKAGRLAAEEWRFVCQLARELGLQDAVRDVRSGGEGEPGPVAGEPDPLASFRGRVAIYTLTESAGRRARMQIQKRSRCTVDLNSDLVGSRPLADLARNADLFVMVTGSATHATTGFIEMHRGDKPLLRPRGRGSSSLLRCLVEHLEQSAEIRTA